MTVQAVFSFWAFLLQTPLVVVVFGDGRWWWPVSVKVRRTFAIVFLIGYALLALSVLISAGPP